MPIYEYECENCGKQCEVIQKFDDLPLSSCPDCGGHMHKLVSHTSFILKGTGWYATDYASGKKNSKDAKVKAGGNKESKTEAVSKN